MIKNKSKKIETDNRFRDFENSLVNVADIEDFLKFLVYGRSGTGKTTILGSLPKPLLYLDVKDKGTKSIKNTEGIVVKQIKNWEDFETAYWYLKSHSDKYKSVVIDTVTQLQDVCLKKVKRVKGSEDDEGLVSKTSRQAFGEASEMMKTWIINYRDLPMVVGFAAQDRLKASDEESDDMDVLIPEVGPYVMPSIAKILNAAVDIIGQAFVREVEKKVKNKETGKIKTISTVEYCLRVGPHPIFTTKFRRDPSIKGEIPNIIVNATCGKLIKISNGEDGK